MEFLEKNLCPGFCGRELLQLNDSFNEAVYSDCGACQWGSRAIEKSTCMPCDEVIEAYDYLYLIFNAISTCFVHCFFVHYYASKTESQLSLRTMLGHLSCFLESCCSFFLSIILLPPIGSPMLYGCVKTSLREWYPMFYNPFYMHVKKLKCTYEIVYPLYSLPFIFIGLNLFFLIIFRSVYCIYASRHLLFSSKPYYAALWALPIITVIHGVFAGLIYYSFPYISLFVSLGLIAIFMAFKGRIGMMGMLKTLTNPSNTIILTALTLFFGFAIFSLGIMYSMHILTAGIISVSCMPLPATFYVVTIGLTRPGAENLLASKMNLPAIILSLGLLGLAAASEGDNSPNFRLCVHECLEKFDCPINAHDYMWTTRNCFQCRYACMWDTVDFFAPQRYVPQFFGKWPFTAWWLDYGSHFVVIQEPASAVFSVMNFAAVYLMYRRIKKAVSLRQRMRNVWLGYCIVGMIAWVASTYFHMTDFWFSELLDYFSACALIMYALFASISFTLKPLQRSSFGRLLWFLIGFSIFSFYLNHISSLWDHFDYGYNMRCCVFCSILTAVIYLLWLANEWLRGRWRESTGTLLKVIIWSFGALAFELLDFAPILWTVDAHSLFHLATVPVPLWLGEFVIGEAVYEADALFKYMKLV